MVFVSFAEPPRTKIAESSGYGLPPIPTAVLLRFTPVNDTDPPRTEIPPWRVVLIAKSVNNTDFADPVVSRPCSANVILSPVPVRDPAVCTEIPPQSA